MSNKNLIKGQPLTFGDAKQIAFLQKKHREMQEMIDSGIRLESSLVKIELSYDISFKCFQCDNGIDLERTHVSDVSPMSDLSDLIEDKYIICSGCKCHYHIEYGTISLIENPVNPEMVTKEEDFV